MPYKTTVQIGLLSCPDITQDSCAPLQAIGSDDSVSTRGIVTNGARYKLSCGDMTGHTFVYVSTCYSGNISASYPADDFLIMVAVKENEDDGNQTTVTLTFSTYQDGYPSDSTRCSSATSVEAQTDNWFSVKTVSMARPEELFNFDRKDLYAVLNILSSLDRTNPSAEELGKYVHCSGTPNVCTNFAPALARTLYNQYSTCALKGAAPPTDSSIPDTVTCYDPDKYYYGFSALWLFDKVQRSQLSPSDQPAFSAILRQYALDYLQNFRSFATAMGAYSGGSSSPEGVVLRTSDFNDVLYYSRVLIGEDVAVLSKFLDSDLTVVYDAVYRAIQQYLGLACGWNVPPLAKHRLTLRGKGENPPVLLDMWMTGSASSGWPLQLTQVPFPASSSSGSVQVRAVGYPIGDEGNVEVSSGKPARGFAAVQLDSSGVKGAVVPLVYLPQPGRSAVAFVFQGVNLMERFGPGYMDVECWARGSGTFSPFQRGAKMSRDLNLCNKTIAADRVVCDCSGSVYVTLGISTPSSLALPLWAILVIALGLLLFVALVLAIILVCLMGSGGCDCYCGCCAGGGHSAGRSRRRTGGSAAKKQRHYVM